MGHREEADDYEREARKLLDGMGVHWSLETGLVAPSEEVAPDGPSPLRPVELEEPPSEASKEDNRLSRKHSKTDSIMEVCQLIPEVSVEGFNVISGVLLFGAR